MLLQFLSEKEIKVLDAYAKTTDKTSEEALLVLVEKLEADPLLDLSEANSIAANDPALGCLQGEIIPIQAIVKLAIMAYLDYFYIKDSYYKAIRGIRQARNEQRFCQALEKIGAQKKSPPPRLNFYFKAD